MDIRYTRNIPALSPEEQETLFRKHVLVVGCGGLGGYVIEFLARMGIGYITACDGDVFEESNLNRQLLATPETIDRFKAAEAQKRAAAVNPGVHFTAVTENFTAENASQLLDGQDLVVDCLDNLPSRFLLEDRCQKKGLPMVHGAIGGWKVQAAVIRPGHPQLRSLYPENAVFGKTSLAFTPPLCAAVEAGEAVRILCGRGSALEGKLWLLDTQSMQSAVLNLE